MVARKSRKEETCYSGKLLPSKILTMFVKYTRLTRETNRGRENASLTNDLVALYPSVLITDHVDNGNQSVIASVLNVSPEWSSDLVDYNAANITDDEALADANEWKPARTVDGQVYAAWKIVDSKLVQDITAE